MSYNGTEQDKMKEKENRIDKSVLPKLKLNMVGPPCRYCRLGKSGSCAGCIMYCLKWR